MALDVGSVEASGHESEGSEKGGRGPWEAGVRWVLLGG